MRIFAIAHSYITRSRPEFTSYNGTELLDDSVLKIRICILSSNLIQTR